LSGEIKIGKRSTIRAPVSGRWSKNLESFSTFTSNKKRVEGSRRSNKRFILPPEIPYSCNHVTRACPGLHATFEVRIENQY
jgi:hypothetical protein